MRADLFVGMVERLDEIKHGICGEKTRTMTVAVLIIPHLGKYLIW